MNALLLRGSLVSLLLAACVQPVNLGTDDAGPPPELFTLQGQVCMSQDDPTSLPVKIVLLVEQSLLMCALDPPGGGGGDPLCLAALSGLMPPVPTEPSRVSALKRELNEWGPSNHLVIVPFPALSALWPNTGEFALITQPTSYDGAMTRLSSFPSETGGKADYDLALEVALSRIQYDVERMERTNPALLPRSRYLVVLLGSGLPGIRCAANDALPAWATADAPDLPFADASPECATTLAGQDRGQSSKLEAIAARIAALQATHRIGEVRLHTLQLFHREAFTACGQACVDEVGPLPGVTPAQTADVARQLGARLLSRLALAGNGTFLAFDDARDLGVFTDLPINTLPLAARNTLKALLLEQLNAVPGTDANRVDRDADGLADDDEPDRADSRDFDGDCFSDAFETRWATYGFDPNEKDPRGCDPMSPLTLGCACRDTDGDGLSQFEEDYLDTWQTFVDSDGDGLPDGMESVRGLDALESNAAVHDDDGDGVPDFEEVRDGTSTSRDDAKFRASHRLAYKIVDAAPVDGRRCYDFTVSNVRLVSPKAPAGGKPGMNTFRIWAGEAPEGALARDYGVWRAACARVRYVPEVGVPDGGAPKIGPSDFVPPSRLVPLLDPTKCVGGEP